MNRLLYLILACLLLPQLATAQIAQILNLNPFKPGFYVLDSNRQLRIQGKLKLANDKLLVKDEQGKTVKYTPEQVRSCRIENRTYAVWSGFNVGAGLHKDYRGASFVEMLDSGQVLLARYHYQVRSYSQGAMGTTYIQDVYLVRGSKSYSSPTVFTSNSSAKELANLQSTLAYYLAQRPDLAQVLAERRIFAANLPAFIHALNTGQPF